MRRELNEGFILEREVCCVYKVCGDRNMEVARELAKGNARKQHWCKSESRQVKTQRSLNTRRV